MNFVIFTDFSRIFMNFYEFILDLFGFLKIKKSCTDVAAEAVAE